MTVPFALAGATSDELQSRINGQHYRVDLVVPDGEPPPAGWPALVIVDAASSFATAVEAMRRMSRRPDATGVVKTVVLGVTLLTSQIDDVRARQRDFTTPRTGDAWSGGASDLLELVTGDVLDFVRARAPLDPRKTTLFGHSLAGYFASWALVEHPRSFARYAAISPSLWWDRERVFAAAARLPATAARALLAVGEWEDELPPWLSPESGEGKSILARRQERRMISAARDFGGTLASRLGAAAVQTLVMPDEDHVSIVSTALPRALRLASAT